MLLSMKKFYLLSLTFFLSVCATKAQNFQIIDNNTGNPLSSNAIILEDVAAGNQSHLYFSIKNLSSSSVTYGLYKTDVAINPGTDAGADAYFCFAGQCYPSTTYTSPTHVTVGAGQFSASVDNIQAYLDEDAYTAGYSEIRYTVYDFNNPSDNFSFTIKYNPTLMSVHENVNVLTYVSNIFPNPSVDKAQIILNSRTEVSHATVTITNALGSIVSVKNISLTTGKNNIILNTEGLNSGLYFATIKTNQHQKITKRFTIEK